MSNRFTQAAKDAANLTNKQLEVDLEKLKLNRDDLKKLMPTEKDKQAFEKLIEQVQSDSDMDNKLAFLKDNLSSVGSVVFKLLKKVVF